MCRNTKLYCDRGQGRWAGAGRAGCAWGAQVAAGHSKCWALGAGRAGVLQARGARWARGRRGRRAGARGALGRDDWAAGAQPGRWARGLGTGRAVWALGARPGRLGSPRAVHSVNLACFWLVSTRYFS